jgi:hypothetical protein
MKSTFENQQFKQERKKHNLKNIQCYSKNKKHTLKSRFHIFKSGKY